MQDLGSLMKQAQAMQEKLQEAQARLAAASIEGSSGGGMVRLTLSGAGELKSVAVDDSLMQPGEGEVLSDLIVAAHADAKRRLDQTQQQMMQDVAGPLAGMGLPGMPKL